MVWPAQSELVWNELQYTNEPKQSIATHLREPLQPLCMSNYNVAHDKNEFNTITESKFSIGMSSCTPQIGVLN